MTNPACGECLGEGWVCVLCDVNADECGCDVEFDEPVEVKPCVCFATNYTPSAAPHGETP